MIAHIVCLLWSGPKSNICKWQEVRSLCLLMVVWQPLQPSGYVGSALKSLPESSRWMRQSCPSDAVKKNYQGKNLDSKWKAIKYNFKPQLFEMSEVDNFKSIPRAWENIQLVKCPYKPPSSVSSSHEKPGLVVEHVYKQCRAGAKTPNVFVSQSV